MDSLSAILTQYGLSIGTAPIPLALFLFIVIWLVSIIFDKPIEIGFGKFSLKLKGRAKGDSKETKKLEHIKGYVEFYDEENRNKDLIEDIREITKDKTKEIDKIILKESITKQMLEAEEANIKIKAILGNAYAELLSEKLGEDKDVKQHKDYRFYQVIISTVLDELKRSTLKQSIKNTDLITLPELEFDKFTQAKGEIMITIVSEYLDFMYTRTEFISRKELYDANEKHKIEIMSIIKDLYKKIKAIILEDNQTIEKINKELDTHLGGIETKINNESPINHIKTFLDKGNNSE